MRDRLEDRHRAFDVADLKLVRRSQEGFLQLARAAQRDDPTAMNERIPIDDRLALEKVVAREQDGPPTGRPIPERRTQPDPPAHGDVRERLPPEKDLGPLPKPTREIRVAPRSPAQPSQSAV